MEQFLACHLNAFMYFGARVPEKVMVDNLKSAVLKRLTGEAPVFNPRCRDFADQAGFLIKPCNVGKGNEKGRVESAVGYVKKNFLNGLPIPDFSALNPAVRVWLETVANVRTHGETQQRPVDAFSCEYVANVLESRARLRPEPGALHLTRRQDLLELDLPEPDLSAYAAGTAQSAKAPASASEANADEEDETEGST
jgi:hypothetical protein